jgi:hypothetical protein
MYLPRTDFIDVTRALFPEAGWRENGRVEPLQVSIQSCSSPCNIPEPNSLALFTGMMGIIVIGFALRRYHVSHKVFG